MKKLKIAGLETKKRGRYTGKNDIQWKGYGNISGKFAQIIIAAGYLDCNWLLCKYARCNLGARPE